MVKKIFSGGEFLTQEISCQEVFTPGDFSDEHKQIADITKQFGPGNINLNTIF